MDVEQEEEINELKTSDDNSKDIIGKTSTNLERFQNTINLKKFQNTLLILMDLKGKMKELNSSIRGELDQHDIEK